MSSASTPQSLQKYGLSFRKLQHYTELIIWDYVFIDHKMFYILEIL